MVDNSHRPLFSYSATIYAFIHKIVTKTEILALVSLLTGTYFKWYWPIFGYTSTVNVLIAASLMTVKQLGLLTRIDKTFVKKIPLWSSYCYPPIVVEIFWSVIEPQVPKGLQNLNFKNFLLRVAMIYIFAKHFTNICILATDQDDFIVD